MLTVSRLQPSTVDIKTLQRRNAAVGCNGNSFIIRYLINVLNFKPESIKKINAKNGYSVSVHIYSHLHHTTCPTNIINMNSELEISNLYKSSKDD